VIGALGEADRAEVGRVGQDHDGRAGRAGAQRGDDLDAGSVGQLDVGDDRIRRLRGDERAGLGEGRGLAGEDVPGLAEARDHPRANGRGAIDDEHQHPAILPRSRAALATDGVRSACRRLSYATL